MISTWGKVILVSLAIIGSGATYSTKIQPSLSASFERNNNENVLISFVGGNTKAINSVRRRSFAGRTERITFLKSALEQQATLTQKNVQDFLNANGVTFKSFWISNQISIKHASKAVVEQLAQFAEVAKVSKEPVVTLEPPSIGNAVIRARKQEELAWGVKTIQADAAWTYSNGTGVLVGLVDTGARHTHEAIRHSFVGVDNYGWYDPILKQDLPYDTYGHGTHVIGTVTGINGIGVAPGAKWMACQSCPNMFMCDISYFVDCSEWMLCPTRVNGTDPDCSKAPHVINNSWGQGQGEEYFEAVGEAWRAAGIIPVFSQGNSGPNCGTANYPADKSNVIGVGATNINDEIAYFSSVGPTVDGRLKPDISAPGQNVYSALPDADDSYGDLSGTSMASPHLTGVVSLMLSINPDMTYDDVRDALLEGVDTNLTSNNATCGGIDDTKFPNHIFGAGRLNALKSVQIAVKNV